MTYRFRILDEGYFETRKENMQNLQHTVARKIEISGVGLHSGRSVQLEILPANPGTGILFKRVDILGTPSVGAHVSNIMSTDLNTTIGTGDVRISTIEHLMAAFVGLGIDNAIVKINGPEIPIMDGSSQPFVESILSAGIVTQAAGRRAFVVRDTFELRQGDKWIRIEPADETSYSMMIDFGSQVIGQQSVEVGASRSEFMELCYSRTFCHVNDVTAMRKAGLALGGSLENAVVVSDTEVLNPHGLRCSDEFVRHKLLDCIGDLALLGAPLIGRIVASKSGHGLHAAFMKALWQRRGDVLAVLEDTGVLRRESDGTAMAMGARV